MSLKLNSDRSGCKDVWNSFLVKSASYEGLFEFPVIAPSYSIPKRLISFSRALSCKEFDQWVHFYEDDYLFERIWNNPRRYLLFLKRFEGVVLPDFSLYRDMPFAMQLWNIYRSRAVGSWLQKNGVDVIVNVRFGDERTYRYCCDGVPKYCVISIGTHGTLKNTEDRKIFVEGLRTVVKNLQPTTIIVYGSAPNFVFKEFIDGGIAIVQFDSDYSVSHRRVG